MRGFRHELRLAGLLLFISAVWASGLAQSPPAAQPADKE